MALERRTCPWCGEEIRKAAILCRYCRQDITDRGEAAARRLAEGKPASAEEEAETYAGDPLLARLGRFLPKSLLKGIVEGAETIEEGERRPIGILFADLSGFSKLTERIGAEAVSDLLELIYEGTRRVVDQYGGAVEKFIGDAVMAVFGAPQAHDDDPERAIRAGLDIRDVVRAIGAERGFELETHSGIAFGEVVVRTAGEGGGPDFETIGEAVNLASHLSQLAKRGQTLVDHKTYLQARISFDWKDLDTVALKGRPEPVRIHRVAGVRKLFAKAALGERIEMAPLVGRRLELQLLREAADRIRDGAARTVLIQGEAGVGKSRLVYELRQALPPDAFQWFTGRCLSFGANMPFLPFVRLLRAIGRPHDRESDKPFSSGELRQTVDRLYDPVRRRARSPSERAAANNRRDAALQTVSLFLSAEGEKNPLLDLSPRERRDRLFDGVADCIAQLCAAKPTVLVFEDMHWADEDSLNLLDHLIPRLQASKALILIVARPQMPHHFPMEENFDHLALTELPPKESQRLLASLLHMEQLPRAVHEKILKKTEGNPFYIEEVVLSLQEQGVLKRHGRGWRIARDLDEVEIPGAVESLVLARLDRLEQKVKRVAQCASVIGVEFRYQTLEFALEAEQRLRSHLMTLVQQGMVRPHSVIAELVYVFQHVVLREVAYHTLLAKRRRFFHARVAAALEELFADRLDEFLEIIAFHYEQGAVKDKALEYLERAAEKCAGLYANRAEADHWERLLALVDQGPVETNKDRRLALKANLRVGEVCRRLGRPERGIAALEKAHGLARALKDAAAEVDALRNLSEALRLAGRPGEGLGFLRSALRRARAEARPDLIASCQNSIGHFQRMQGEFVKARNAFEKTLRYAEEAGNRALRYQALNHLGILRMHAGEVEQANRWFAEALELAKELGRKNEQAQIEMNIGINHLRMGQCDPARERLASAAALAESIEYEFGAALSHVALVDLYLKQGDFRGALALSRRLMRRLEDARFNDIQSVAFTNQARAQTALGRLQEAEVSLKRAMDLVARDENIIGLLDALSVQSELHLARGAAQDALRSAEEFLGKAQGPGGAEFLAMAQTQCARCRLALKQPDAGLNFAAQAVKTARRAKIPRDEGWALWVRGQCEEALGRGSRARSSWEGSLRIARAVQDSALTQSTVASLGKGG